MVVLVKMCVLVSILLMEYILLLCVLWMLVRDRYYDVSNQNYFMKIMILMATETYVRANFVSGSEIWYNLLSPICCFTVVRIVAKFLSTINACRKGMIIDLMLIDFLFFMKLLILMMIDILCVSSIMIAAERALV